MNQTSATNVPVSNFAMRTLEDDEISLISGGHPVLIVAAGVAAAFGALNAAEGFGEKIGKAVYYVMH